MADAEGGSGGNIITELISSFFALLGEMFSAFVEFAPKVFSFLFWILAAVFILPCVFVSGVIYPMWEKWGEDF